MIEYDRNLQDQLDDLPLEEDEQNDGPIETDELDDLISDALHVDEDDDDEGDDEEGSGENNDDDEDDDSSEGGANAEHSPPAQGNKKKGRSALRRAKEAIKREQLRSELEKTRQEAQQARALAEQERSRAYGMEALIKTISGGASMDEILALATNNGNQVSQQNTQEAPLTAKQLEEWYRNKAALNNEMTSLQSAWLPIHQRVAKTAPQVTSWFDHDFTVGIEANPQRRDLLKAVSSFSYPMEALYAASRKEGFERLSVGEQISLVHRCSSKIAERNKPEPTRQKREALKTPSSSSVNSRLPAEKISNEDWFNRMYPNPT